MASLNIVRSSVLASRRERGWVVWPQNPLADGDHRLEHLKRLADASHGPVHTRQVVPTRERHPVLRPEEALQVGHQRLEDGESFRMALVEVVDRSEVRTRQ